LPTAAVAAAPTVHDGRAAPTTGEKPSHVYEGEKMITRRKAFKWAGAGGMSLMLADSASARAEAGPRQAPSASNETYVMVSNVSANPYWIDAQDGGRDAAAELGVRWQYTGPAAYDTPAQVSTFEQLISTKPAGIVVPALQPAALTASINKALSAGIPVVTVDTDAPASNRLTYLGTENYQAGVVMGQRIVQVLGGKGKVGLSSVPGQYNLEQRIQGIRDSFKGHPGMLVVAIVDNKADDSAAATAVAALIQAHPDLGLVASINATGAGVVAALRQTGQVGKVKAVLFDRNPAILQAVKAGIADSTLIQRTYMFTYLGVRLLYSYNHPTKYLATLRRNRIDTLPNSVDTGIIVATKDVVGAFM